MVCGVCKNFFFLLFLSSHLVILPFSFSLSHQTLSILVAHSRMSRMFGVPSREEKKEKEKEKGKEKERKKGVFETKIFDKVLKKKKKRERERERERRKSTGTKFFDKVFFDQKKKKRKEKKEKDSQKMENENRKETNQQKNKTKREEKRKKQRRFSSSRNKSRNSLSFVPISQKKNRALPKFFFDIRLFFFHHKSTPKLTSKTPLLPSHPSTCFNNFLLFF